MFFNVKEQSQSRPFSLSSKSTTSLDGSKNHAFIPLLIHVTQMAVSEISAS